MLEAVPPTPPPVAPEQPTPAPARANPASAQMLRHLLVTDPRCRRQWQRYAVRRTHELPHQAGVAHVIAHHLWDEGEESWGRDELPQALKDRVSRALRGRGISQQTLRWFVDAFDLDPEQEDLLYRAWEEDNRFTPYLVSVPPA